VGAGLWRASDRCFIIRHLTVWLAFGEREKTLMQYRESHSIDRIEQLISALDTLPTANRESFLATAPRLGLQVTTLPENISDTARARITPELSANGWVGISAYCLCRLIRQPARVHPKMPC
jgi:hypothetical protein